MLCGFAYLLSSGRFLINLKRQLFGLSGDDKLKSVPAVLEY